MGDIQRAMRYWRLSLTEQVTGSLIAMSDEEFSKFEWHFNGKTDKDYGRKIAVTPSQYGESF